MDGGEEVAVGFIVAGCDGAELFEPAEEVLDQVPRFVQVLVVGTLVLAVGSARDDCCLAGVVKRLDDTLLGIEGLVGDQHIGRDIGKQRVGSVQVMSLARRKMEAGRIAERIHGGVDLGAQSAFAAADRLRAVFLSAPALC